jgi:hypothetical protein
VLMNSRSFRQTMLWLAMIATLLMALMPSLVRVTGHAFDMQDQVSAQAVAVDGTMHSMCGHNGMMGATSRSVRHGNNGCGDCEYCPLLASLALPVLALLILPTQGSPAGFLSRRLVALPVAERYPCGLGSRGPPLVA